MRNNHLSIIYIVGLLASCCLAADNYLMQQTFAPYSNCNGEALTTQYYKTNTCFNSTYVTCSTEEGVSTLLTYEYEDCSGAVITTNKGCKLQFKSSDVLYNTNCINNGENQSTITICS
ncbi:hypothetical protein PPL_05574 [Heterostelium album PN500]|uniref:Uncharacterized protein n=1 Tax=Heterostelium pallidum (strain ATCC 26659 / Pp 5 / PN500) TaxID=670386 RepID=D3BAJ6_HETP5|nr:hypothetical protein PPL_05574 [Heterostelium album PN500]EFA81583.1 hypothetical protein PPL_05574 [Heterostelium album PN500]|eukprot:XP_020433700.1 hypothetical protein PPL_05574 [Heterostelium album PN500]